ncbi:MAG: hypothetical protein RBR19_17220 [Sedimentisphaerales bacterium]|nr:hypothetical protein [Sedimentisphaerales bacterium]
MFCPTMTANVVELASWNITESVSPYQDEQLSSMLISPVDGLHVGQTRYRFVRPANLNYLPKAKGWTCSLIGLTGYVGQGDTPEQAFDELKLSIHTDFQVLLRKRPFEMDETERCRWVRLTSIIDLLHYRTTTPIKTRELGQVSFRRISRPYRVKWISGENYRINPERVPAELMSCATGQWVEAEVVRHPVSHKILRIESVRKVSFRLPSAGELISLWENMPKAEVERGEWAW